MRAFGPGSVSSFLKTVLDVVVYALWASLGLGAAALVLTLLAQPFLGAPGGPPRFSADLDRILHRGPAVMLLLVGIEVWMAALLVVTDRLRRVFGTLTEGRPFRPQNAERLRAIGLALIVLQLSGYALPMLLTGVFDVGRGERSDVNVSGWFSILVVFVLAEVFREGARLQAEAELTV